ncbi:hypothetical protein DDE18_03515 [Nocardioides gansuensis]|uniref:DUF2786 domain-containing protein n=1 Tax=Nocardioides gansuensis TaxID=2138300 RepID=A0A2T8FG56_9ACTN|nr:DUF2786 domain-containing protein [Nocardioides gansuensis]PVG84680.1 hypothetical protein DDE18_03515 [Nocardioides gansuensis]
MDQPDHDTTAMLAKVRKLLAKAEDPATTPEEAELYTAKASDLIAAYGIDRALLALADPSLDIVGDQVIVLDRPYAADKLDLLSTIALTLRCHAVRRTRHPDGVQELSLHLFGHSSDLQRVEILFTSLLVQAMHALARTPVPPWDHPAAFRRSWLAGFTMSVGRRLDEAEKAAAAQADRRFAASGTSTALVLADRSAAVERARDEAYPDLRRATPRQLSGSGARQGWEAGQRADLGGERLHGGRRALPG